MAAIFLYDNLHAMTLTEGPYFAKLTTTQHFKTSQRSAAPSSTNVRWGVPEWLKDQSKFRDNRTTCSEHEIRTDRRTERESESGDLKSLTFPLFMKENELKWAKMG